MRILVPSITSPHLPSHTHRPPPQTTQQQQGLPWIQDLLTHDYNDLPLSTRVEILTALVQMALDSPSARIIMEERVAAAARIRKQMWEEARVCVWDDARVCVCMGMWIMVCVYTYVCA